MRKLLIGGVTSACCGIALWGLAAGSGSENGPPTWPAVADDGTERPDPRLLSGMIFHGALNADPDAELHGASAGWTGSGSSRLDENDATPITDLVLHGAEDRTATAEVTVEAVLGYAAAVLVSETVILAAGQEAKVPVALTDGLDVDPLQFNYPTTIRAQVTWTLPGESHPISRKIAHRTLVFDEVSGVPSAYDPDAFAMAFPDGTVTTEATLRRADAVLQAEAEAAEGDFVAVAPGVGSGVYRFTPE